MRLLVSVQRSRRKYCYTVTENKQKVFYYIMLSEFSMTHFKTSRIGTNAVH